MELGEYKSQPTGTASSLGMRGNQQLGCEPSLCLGGAAHGSSGEGGAALELWERVFKNHPMAV